MQLTQINLVSVLNYTKDKTMESRLIQELVDKKASQDNRIDLFAYAAGLTDMHNALSQKNNLSNIAEPEVKLKKFEFRCDGCKKVHEMSSYAIAQIAMGHAIIHNCECGNKNELTGFND